MTDPRAVPMVMKVFGSAGESMQLMAVQVLSQIQGPAASLWLAALAVDSPSATVRARADDALARRDVRDVLAWLIARVHKPYKYQIKPAQGPGTTAALLVDGEQFDIRRLYRIPTIDDRLGPPVGLVRDFDLTIDSGGNATLTPGALPLGTELGAYVAVRQQLLIAQAEQSIVARQLATDAVDGQ